VDFFVQFRVVSRMKFEPAVNNGKPVSQFVTVEYNFSTY
jgi:hypothetical protein